MDVNDAISPEENSILGGVLEKLKEASYRFDRDRNGEVMKTLECRDLDKDLFRHTLRATMMCKLTEIEMNALMTVIGENGFVNGPKFLLLFYRLRFQMRDEILKRRINEEKKNREILMKQLEQKGKRVEKDSRIVLPSDFTEEDRKSAFDKMTDAAVKYDRLMPGAVQTDAFEVECMTPLVFREQIKRVFNLRLNSKELAAVVKYFDTYDTGSVNCAEFLVQFFKLGFEAKSERMKAHREKEKRAMEERERKRMEELVELEKKNALKCNFTFTEEDKTIAKMKLREAAKLYNKSSSAAASMKAFESAYMLPHEFKDQLKRVFNLHVTAPQLGALMSIFDGKVIFDVFVYFNYDNIMCSKWRWIHYLSRVYEGFF